MVLTFDSIKFDLSAPPPIKCHHADASSSLSYLYLTHVVHHLKPGPPVRSVGRSVGALTGVFGHSPRKRVVGGR